MEKANLLNIDEVCTVLGVKKSWVRAAIFYKRLPHLKIGKLIRFSQDEIMVWIESQKKEVDNARAK